MVASTLTDREGTDWSVATGELVFRVCGSSRDGQIVRLKSPKCTIGAGPRCTLRLRARGVAPVHCLVLRGRSGTVVRRWAPDTRLNSADFTDAALRTGDRLGIGPIELEVVSVGVNGDASTPAASEECQNDAAAHESWHVESDDRLQQLDDQLQELAAWQAELKTRQDAFDDQRRQWEADREAHAAQAAARAEELRARLAGIEQERLSLDETIRVSRIERDATQERIDEQRREINDRLTAIEARENSLLDERRQWDIERDAGASNAANETELLRAKLADVERERQSLDETRRAWQAEQELLRNQLEAERREFESRAADLDARQTALADERWQWELHRDARASEAATETDLLQAKLADVERERQSLDEARRAWQAEQESLRNQLEAERREFESRAADLDARQTAFADEQRQWESQCDAAASQNAVEAAELEEIQSQRVAMEEERNGLEEARRALNAEQESARRRLEEQTNEINVRTSDLDARENALSDEHRQWKSERDEAAAQSAAESESLRTERAELDAERASFDEARRAWEAEQDEARRQREEAERDSEEQRRQLADAQANVESRQNELSEAQAELESRRDALADERRQWDKQRVETQTADPTPAAETGDEPESSSQSTPEEVQFETPTEQSPVNLADVFRRLGASVDVDDEPEATIAAPPQPSSATGDIPRPTARPPAAHADDEESIDDYMSRLMQRVGGTGTSKPETAPLPSTPAPEARASSEGNEPTTDDARDAATVLPRATAPERHISLSVLREVANASAKIALNEHAHKETLHSIRSKLVVVIVALACGAGLWWMSRGSIVGPTTSYAIMAALVVAIYWGLQYAVQAGRLTVGKSGEIDWNRSPHAARQTPECSADETAPPESRDSSDGDDAHDSSDR